MSTSMTRLFGLRLFLTVIASIALGIVPTTHAAVTSYMATLDGPSEDPPNASPGMGLVQVDIDDVAHTMRVRASFAGLLGTTTVAHIHAPTVVAGTGSAGVATTTPTFPGFPSGVTSGMYVMIFDMTQASSYNPSYITANGGSPATAEAALFQSIAEGRAYFNIHSSQFSGGEIRGFLVPGQLTPVNGTTWGRIKDLYR